MLVTYEPRATYFIEWFKQLFGESEGKDNKGIFPAKMGKIPKNGVDEPRWNMI